MNFLGIFKTVVKDAGEVAPAAAFGISMFNPALGAIVSRIGTAMVQAEAYIPDTSPSGSSTVASGAAKAQAVTNDFAASMALTQTLLAQAGKTMTWDPTKLQKVIDAQAAAFNLYHDLATSIKIVDAPLNTIPPINTVPPTKPIVAG